MSQPTRIVHPRAAGLVRSGFAADLKTNLLGTRPRQQYPGSHKKRRRALPSVPPKKRSSVKAFRWLHPNLFTARPAPDEKLASHCGPPPSAAAGYRSSEPPRRVSCVGRRQASRGRPRPHNSVDRRMVAKFARDRARVSGYLNPDARASGPARDCRFGRPGQASLPDVLRVRG